MLDSRKSEEVFLCGSYRCATDDPLFYTVREVPTPPHMHEQRTHSVDSQLIEQPNI
jgi:hypothetical protein